MSSPQTQAKNQEQKQDKASLDRFVDAFQPVLKHVNLHRFLWLFTLVCAFIAWNRGLMLLYGLVAFLLAVLFVSYLYRFLNLKNINITSHFPDSIEAGNAFDASYELTASGTRHFVDIAQSWVNTTQSKLSLPKQDDTENELHLFLVRFKKWCSLNKSVLFNHRGVYVSDTYQLTSAYPLGIVESKKTLNVPTQTLHVLPETFPVSHIPLMTSDQSSQGSMTSQAKGSMDEFSGIRRYRKGDGFNMIHWPTTAKQASRGQPWVAKDFDSLDSPNMLIVINQLGIRDHDSFEMMLSIASSVAQHMSQQGFPVTIYGVQHEATGIDTTESAESITDADRLEHLLEHAWHIKLQPLETYITENLKQLASTQWVNTSIQPSGYQELITNAIANVPQANVVMTFSRHSLSFAGNKTHLDVNLRPNQPLSKQLTNQGCQYMINPDSPLSDVSRLFTDGSGGVSP